MITDSAEFQEKLKAACDDLVSQHNLATEQLTAKQIAEALRQAILAGDFQRHVRARGQRVVYLPYWEVRWLRRQIDELRAELAIFRAKEKSEDSA